MGVLLQKLHSLKHEHSSLVQTQLKDDKQHKRVAALQKLKAALLKMKKEGKKLNPKVRQVLLQKLHSMKHELTAPVQTQPKDDKQQKRVAALPGYVELRHAPLRSPRPSVAALQKLKAVLLKMKKEGKKLNPE